MGGLQVRLACQVQGTEIQHQAHHAGACPLGGNPTAESGKVEDERKYVEELYKEELLREADRTVDLTYASYKDEFNRMQDCITDGLLYCMQRAVANLNTK